MARVYAIAQAFTSWGIVKGDRIALLAENRWEWPVVDFATLVLGAADVPIYPTLTAEQIASLLIDSGARIAVVSTQAQYDKIASIRSRTQLERVVVMDDIDDREAPRSPRWLKMPTLQRLPLTWTVGCAALRSSRRISPPSSILRAPPASPRG